LISRARGFLFSIIKEVLVKIITAVLLVLVVALASTTGYLGYRVATEPTSIETLTNLTKDSLSTMSAMAPVIAFSSDDVPGKIGDEPFIDDLGREVSIPADSPIENIVCLNPFATETIFYFGADDKLVGVSNAWTGDSSADYPGGPGEYESWITTPEDVDNEIEKRVWEDKDLAALPAAYQTSPGSPSTLNPEVTLAPQNIDGTDLVQGYPDLVFIYSDNIEYAAGIEDLVPVICIHPGTLEEILYDITLIGKVLGKESEAEQLVNEMKDKIIDVAGMTIDQSKPKVFLETGYWMGTIYTTGGDSFLNSLICIAGGDDIGEVVNDADISSEYIIASDPEIVIISHTYTTATDLADRPGWGYITAVKSWQADNEEGIYQLSEESMDKISRAGPRIVEDGLDVLLAIIHPELSE